MEFFIIHVNKFDGIILIYIMIQSYWQVSATKTATDLSWVKGLAGDLKGRNTTSDEVYTSGSH